MKEIQYKKFSWGTHEKNWRLKRPNVCQFELTFRCALHCRHCYTDCYNNPEYTKRELNTKQVKVILDKAHDAGVIWACFTGGDPLMRSDFLQIYDYAKLKGFIVTVFSTGYSMTGRIAAHLKKSPPFVVEMTLNGATEETYEKITQVKGSFRRTMAGIELMLKNKIPLKIKTQITSDNFHEADKIKKLVNRFGLKFAPSSDIFARLSGDCAPCSLRVPVRELLKVDGNEDFLKDECLPKGVDEGKRGEGADEYLFTCAAGGGDGVNIDPYGNTFLCNLLRSPSINLLEKGVLEARDELIPLARGRKFSTPSKCRSCALRRSCHWCPGRAYVETGDMEAPVNYFCELARASSGAASGQGPS